jgi:predicted O-methyltransferase YrrM
MQDSSVLSADVARFVRLIAPEQDDVLADLEARNREQGFPMVGPEVGSVLRLLARMVDASRVFEFGSGLGYSGYWFASGLPEDGLVVLAEEDAAELQTVRAFFERGGLADRAAFEAGDAHETFATYEDPFDVVLIDHRKERYAEAFQAVREKLAPGGLVIADNALMLSETLNRGVLEHLAGDATGGDGTDAAGDAIDLDPDQAGIADYLDAVRAAPEFETVALPLGEGITVSLKRRDGNPRA